MRLVGVGPMWLALERSREGSEGDTHFMLQKE